MHTEAPAAAPGAPPPPPTKLSQWQDVMQVLGPLLAGLAALGGLWFPIDKGSVLDHISSFTPIYGLAHLARWPLYGGAPHLVWIVNLVAWLAVFVAGAAWRMSKDTARV